MQRGKDKVFQAQGPGEGVQADRAEYCAGGVELEDIRCGTKYAGQ